MPQPTIPLDEEEEERGHYDFVEDIDELNEEIDTTLPTTIAETTSHKAAKRSDGIPEIVIPKSRQRTSIRAVDAAMRSAEGEASKAAAHRRRQIVWMFFGALGAIAVGTGLVFIAERNSAPPELPPIHRDSIAVLPAPVPVAPIPPTHSEVSTGGGGVTTAPIQPELVTTRPVITEPVPVPPIMQTPIIPETPRFPATLTLGTQLSQPKSGGGIADSSQSLALPIGEFDTSARVTGMRLRLPAAVGESASGATDAGDYSHWAYKDGFEGTILEEVGRSASASAAAGPVILTWKDASGSMDVMSLALDQNNPNRPALNVAWKAAALMKRPEVVNLAYWLLQNSTLETRHGAGGAESSQQISFKRPADQMVDISAESTTLAFQGDMPKDFVVVAPTAGDGSGLPAGWEATWYTDWDEKDAALRTADNAAQVVKFRKGTTSGAVDAWFLLRFGPGLKTVGSTFTMRRQDAQTQEDQAAKELQDTDDEIAALKKQFGGSYDSSEKSKTLAKTRADAQTLVDAYKEAIASYDEVTNLNVTIGLPGGLRVATVRFHRPEKPGTNQGQ